MSTFTDNDTTAIDGPVRPPAAPDTWVSLTRTDSVPAVPARVGRPTAVVNRLAALLSRLEHGRARLAAPRTARRPAAALGVVAEMLDELLAFPHGKEELGNGSPAFLEVLGRAFEQAGAARTLAAALTVSPLRAVFRALGRGTEADGRPQQAAALVRGLPGLVGDYFAALALPLPAAAAAEWGQVVQLFVADLKQVTDRLEF